MSNGGSGSGTQPTRHLWIGGIPGFINSNDVHEHFQRYGEVETVKLLPRKGGAGQAAFVDFIHLQSCIDAFEDKAVMQGHAVRLDYNTPRRSRPPGGGGMASHKPGEQGKRLYMSELAPHVQEGEIRAVVSQFGLVDTINVVSKKDYAFAFVAMSTSDDASAVLAGMNQRPFPTIGLGPTKSVRVAHQRSSSGGGDGQNKGRDRSDRDTFRDRDRDRRDSAREGRGRVDAPSSSKRPRPNNDVAEAAALLADRPGALDGMTMEPPTAASTAIIGHRFTVGARASVKSDGPLLPLDREAYQQSERSGAPPSETGSSDSQSTLKNSSLYVTNFPLDMPDHALKAELQLAAESTCPIISVHVFSSHHPRYAFVNCRSTEDAGRILAALNGKAFHGQALTIRYQRESRVSKDVLQRERGDVPPPTPEHEQGSTRTLWVGNLGPNTSSRDLQKEFSRFGTVVSVDVKHQKTGSTYAFVKFNSINDAARARANLNGRPFDGFAAKIGYGKATPSSALWLGGLRRPIDDQAVQGVCKRYGKVMCLTFIRSGSEVVVEFETPDVAESALNKLLKVRDLSIADQMLVEFADPLRNRLDKPERPPLGRGGLPRRSRSRSPISRRGDWARERERRSPERSRGGQYDRSPPRSANRGRSPERRGWPDEGGRGRQPGLLPPGRRDSSPPPRRRSPPRGRGSSPARSPSRDRRYGNTPVQSQGWHNDREQQRGGGYGAEPSFRDQPEYGRGDRYGDNATRATGRRDSYPPRGGRSVGRDFEPPPPPDNYQHQHQHQHQHPRQQSHPQQPQQPQQPQPRRYDDGGRSRADSSTSRPLIEDPGRHAATAATVAAAAPSPSVVFGRYPVMWRGQLGLKTQTTAVQIHVVSGALDLVSALPVAPGPLKITKRMRLEPSKLAAVAGKLEVSSDYCMMLVRPDEDASGDQAGGLRSNFVNYLQEKQAAGIADSPSGMFYVFPPSDFARTQLSRAAPTLDGQEALDGHLLLVFTRG